MATWVVYGAGTAAVNGRYEESGTFGGKAAYTNGTYWLFWGTTLDRWLICTSKGDFPDGVFTFYGGAAAEDNLPANDWVILSDGHGEGDSPTLGLGYAVSGTVLDGEAAPVETVTVAASGEDDATDGSGDYALTLDDGTHRVVPSKTNWLFSPAYRDVVVNGEAVTDVDFTGTNLGLTPGATPGHGTFIYINLWPIGCLLRLTPQIGGDVPEVTNHDSDYAHREFVGGLREGELTLEALYTQAGFELLRAQAQGRTLAVYRIVYPGGGGWWQFTGLCVSLDSTAAVDDALRCSATFKMTGKPTWSWEA